MILRFLVWDGHLVNVAIVGPWGQKILLRVVMMIYDSLGFWNFFAFRSKFYDHQYDGRGLKQVVRQSGNEVLQEWIFGNKNSSLVFSRQARCRDIWFAHRSWCKWKCCFINYVHHPNFFGNRKVSFFACLWLICSYDTQSQYSSF